MIFNGGLDTLQYSCYSAAMNRIESIQKSLTEAKASLYSLKKSGADAEVIADAEARVRMNQKALDRNLAKS